MKKSLNPVFEKYVSQCNAQNTSQPNNKIKETTGFYSTMKQPCSYYHRIFISHLDSQEYMYIVALST